MSRSVTPPYDELRALERKPEPEATPLVEADGEVISILDALAERLAAGLAKHERKAA